MDTRSERLRKLPALILLVLGCYLLFRSYVYRPSRQIDVATLKLRDLRGEVLPAALMTHRPVVLNFWAPWCPPCLREMPWLGDLQQHHADVTVVGIEHDASALPEAAQLQESHAFAYTLAAPNAQTQKAFSHLSALPTTLYISRSGAVVHVVTGLVPESVMERYLQDAISHE